MIEKYTFYKEDNGEWFIDLPLDVFTKADLQMVCGADTMLDILANGEKQVILEVSLEVFEGADVMLQTKLGENEGGAYYSVPEINGSKFNTIVWLCDVTKNVFGEFPVRIFLKNQKIYKHVLQDRKQRM